MHEELKFKADVTAHKVCRHIRLKLNLFGGGEGVGPQAMHGMPKA